MSNNSYKPLANPNIIFREDFDDWAILFNPDNGKSFGLNPVSAFIWKCLDSKHTIHDIASELREVCDNVPDDAERYIEDFIKQLEENGMIALQCF